MLHGADACRRRAAAKPPANAAIDSSAISVMTVGPPAGLNMKYSDAVDES
jgi:hypothetical protein